MTRNPSLNQALAILGTITPDTLRHAIHDGLPGHPKGTSYDTDRTTSGQSPADPTANAATTPNRNAHDMATLEAAVVRIYTAALHLAALQDFYCPAHEPRRTDIMRDTKGCEWHHRAGVEEHQPVAHRTDFASVLTTPLREPIACCLACYNFVRDHQHPPTPEELRRHARTGKWKARVTTTYSVESIAATRPDDPEVAA